MATESKAPEVEQAKERKRAEPAPLAEQTDEVAAAELTNGPLAAAGDGTIDGQAARLRHGRLLTAQRQMLARNIEQAQGNRYLQRALALPSPGYDKAPALEPARQVSSSHIQRQPGPPGSAGMKIPYSYTLSGKLDVGKYVKLTGWAVKAAGVIEAAQPGGAGGGSSDTMVTPVEGGQGRESGENLDAIAVGVEVKREANNWLADRLRGFGDNVKPYEQANVSGLKKRKGSEDTSVEGKVSFTSGVNITPFLSEIISLEFSAEFVVVGFEQKPGEKPEFKWLAVEPKASLGGTAKDWPVDGFGASLSVEVSVTLEPDYEALLQAFISSPYAWVLAAAAGTALIIYFTYEDTDRRMDLARKVRFEANDIARAANAYGAFISGKDVSARGKHESEAVAQANADLFAILAEADMDEVEYFERLEAEGLEDKYFSLAVNDYRQEALRNLYLKVQAEVEAWHDDHMWQDFWSGGSASEDMANVGGIIDEAKETGGEGSMRAPESDFRLPL